MRGTREEWEGPSGEGVMDRGQLVNPVTSTRDCRGRESAHSINLKCGQAISVSGQV